MTKTIEVRYALREELEQVNALRQTVRALHATGRPDIFPAGDGESLDAFNAFAYEVFDSKKSGVIVACSGDEICGFAVVVYVEKPASPYTNQLRYYHVAEFGVDEARRRQGVATALIEFMREDARQRGFQRIELDFWEFNQEARKFYEAVGFQTYRRHMELWLGENGDEFGGNGS